MINQNLTLEAKSTKEMRTYLTNLIAEKGKNLDDSLNIDGHFGLTYQSLVDFILTMPTYFKSIRETLVKIDFMNGDVFHYFNHLGNGMIKSLGY